MSYDVNGVYTLPNGYRATSGNDILPSQHNPPLEDIGASLSLAFVRDGRAPATGDFDMNGNKVTNIADGTNPQDAATVGQAAYAIGDFKDSARPLEPDKWLRRNGTLYNIADYPELAALLPPLTDTINWTSVYSASNTTLRDFAQSGSTIVAVGDGATAGTCVILTSTDNGLTWSQTYSSSTEYLFGVLKTASGWCAIGSRTVSGPDYNFLAVTSSDGVTWTATQVSTTYRYFPPSGNRHTFNGTAIVAGVTRKSDGAPFVARSTDNGASWSYALSPFTFHGGIASSPTRTVITDGTNVVVSLDQGTTFGSPTASNIGTDQIGNSTYDTINSKMVFCQSGKFRFSTDGITWTTVGISEAGVSFGLSAGAIGVITRTSTKLQLSSNSTSAVNYSAPGATSYAVHAHKADASVVLMGVAGGALYRGVRTLPTQFQAPDDNPTYGWIKALP